MINFGKDTKNFLNKKTILIFLYGNNSLSLYCHYGLSRWNISI